MKLEELLGAELYAQVQAKLNEVNSKESDKLKQVRYVDLSEGDYVSKAKFEELETKFNSKETELGQANALIEELREETSGDQELQDKIEAYKGEVADLKVQLADANIKSAVKVALLAANAADVDYLTFKLNESLKKKGGKLELDENGNIKNWDTQLDGLKTQFPAMFGKGKDKKLGSQRLPESDGGEGGNEPTSLEEALRMQYEGTDDQ